MGAVRGLPVRHGILFDRGGGSMQVSRFRDRKLLRSWSSPSGPCASPIPSSGRITGPRELRRLQNHVVRFLEEADVKPLHSRETLIGTGGTVRNLAKIDQRWHGYPLTVSMVTSSRGSDSTTSRPWWRRGVRRSVARSGTERRSRRSIVGGGVAIQALVDVLEAPAIQVSGRAYAKDGLRPDVAEPAA